MIFLNYIKNYINNLHYLVFLINTIGIKNRGGIKLC